MQITATYDLGNSHSQELSISTVDLVLKGSSKIVKKILCNNDFWAGASKGRCPVGHRGEFRDVHPSFRPPPLAIGASILQSQA